MISSLFSLAFVALCIAGYAACFKWGITRLSDRLVAGVHECIVQAGSGDVGSLPRFLPESLFVVRLTDEEVICNRPDGKTERVIWNDLQRMEVVTTADGPGAPDVFWALFDKTGGCVVPQGATGGEVLLMRLQTLPGFDNANFIRAMESSEFANFPCWRRTEEAGLVAA